MELAKLGEHAADPLNPLEYADLEDGEFWLTAIDAKAKGVIYEVLLHDADSNAATSGIFYISEVYDRQVGCPGQFVSVYALAHEDPKMEAQCTRFSRNTDKTIGKPILLHICDGPSCHCTATRNKSFVVHCDAYRQLNAHVLTADGLRGNTRSGAFVAGMPSGGESQSRRVQNRGLDWLKEKLPVLQARLRVLAAGASLTPLVGPSEEDKNTAVSDAGRIGQRPFPE